MNRLVFSLAVAAITSATVHAADSDPGNGSYAGQQKQSYYRPTQRYYGDGYTIAYRFVPWKERARKAPSSFEIQQLDAVPARAVVAKSGPSPRATRRWSRGTVVTAPVTKTKTTTTTTQ